MTELYRRSPVRFSPRPKRMETRDSWQVTLEYDNEGAGPFLVDLSHRTRLDLQDSDLTTFTPFGMTIPDIPCASTFAGGVLINRMNRTQASVLHLAGEAPGFEESLSYTDVTEATVCLGVFGKNAFSIAEKLSALDFQAPDRTAPFLFQGPLSHVPCQITVIDNAASAPGFVVTCSRGYADDMAHSLLDAGKEFGITPAGEDRFTAWLAAITN